MNFLSAMNESSMYKNWTIAKGIPDGFMEFRTISYIVMGSMNLVCNYFIIIVVLSDRALSRRSILLLALAAGNSFEGMYKLSRGLSVLLRNPTTAGQLVTVWTCALRFRCSFQLISYQAPAATLTANGLERVLAVVRPAWYRGSCTWKTSVCAVLAICAYVVCVPLTVHFADAWTRRNVFVDSQCDWRATVDSRLTRYLHVASIVCGTFCIGCTLAALFLCRNRMRRFDPRHHRSVLIKSQRRLGRQLQLSKSMFCVAFLDLFFMVLPNVFLLVLPLARLPRSWSLYLSIGSLLAYCANSLPHPFVYYTYNRAFRRVVRRLFGFGYLRQTSTMGKSNLNLTKTHLETGTNFQMTPF